MEISSYVDGILGTLSELTAIHSPTGYTKDAADYVLHTLEQLGYAPEQTRKGGVLCCLGGPEGSEGLLLSAHVDTLGGMVAEVKANGRLRLASGGFANPNTEAENVTIITREGKRYDALPIYPGAGYPAGGYRLFRPSYPGNGLRLYQKPVFGR